jgi:AcrR family transcriptional regulator
MSKSSGPPRHATRTTAAAAPGKPPGVREQAAMATREAILRAAVRVFARHGYAGGRVEMISRGARTHDRMIYYYFGSKRGLYVAALEEIYRRFDIAESALQLDESKPVEALKAMIGFIWGYYQAHPEFIALLNTENLHRGRHIGKAAGAAQRGREGREGIDGHGGRERREGRSGQGGSIAPYASAALALTERVLKAGVRAGQFRRGLAARDIYLLIAALGYFYLSNRYTLSAFLGETLDRPEALAHWGAFIIDAVLRTVAA